MYRKWNYKLWAPITKITRVDFDDDIIMEINSFIPIPEENTRAELESIFSRYLKIKSFS